MPTDALDFSPQVVVLVLLALPGLIGHAVFAALTYTAEPSWSGRAVVGIVLSAVAYALTAALQAAPHLGWMASPAEMLAAAPRGLLDMCSWNTLGTVLTACTIAIGLGGGVAIGHNHRLLYRTANRLGLTTRTGFVREWDAAMLTRARDRWVYAVLEDGSAFGGWLQSHDIASEETTIVLSSVTQISAAGDVMHWPVDEQLVLPSRVPIKYLRLVPHSRSPHEAHGESAATNAALADHSVGEPEPESSAARLCASDTDSPEAVQTGRREPAK